MLQQDRNWGLGSEALARLLMIDPSLPLGTKFIHSSVTIISLGHSTCHPNPGHFFPVLCDIEGRREKLVKCLRRLPCPSSPLTDFS